MLDSTSTASTEFTLNGDQMAVREMARAFATEVFAPNAIAWDEAKHFPVADNGLPVSDKIAEEVISLPMHAYLDEATQDRIIDAVRGALTA